MDKNQEDKIEQNEMTKEEIEILKLQNKIKLLKEQQLRKRRKEKEKMRKARTKKLIEVGGLSEKMLGTDGTEELRERLEVLLKMESYLNQTGIYTADDLHKKIGGRQL